MLEILSITGPIYLAIAAGVVSMRLGLFSRGDTRVMGTFVVNIALPCLLFSALIRRPVAGVLDPVYLVAYALGILVTAGLGALWAWRVRRLSGATSIIMAMGMACPNSGFVGFPVILLTLPAVAGQVLAMNLLVENLVALPLLMALADQAAGVGVPWYRAIGQAARRLARNPLVIAIVLGLVVSGLGIPVPTVLDRTVTLFSQVSSGLSLFAIGAALGATPASGFSLRGLVGDVLPITLGKLIGHPLITIALVAGAGLLGLPALTPDLQGALILSAAMPMLSIYPILVLRHGHETLASTAVVVTTLATAVTLTLVLWVFSHHLPLLGG